ncbi:hypothetical protein [Sediminibacillus albus]|uniref:Uncharacterized protein n=1 Tax=Sediminibacillus albus TaxID=407036 RepID=A0A1G9C762_9BACI|nr:hypothetical protein [Sediminibacillus albus]SDK47508.1 hypothetical protein SAMN05216243_3289 [Sediminibacillus albus]
MNELDRSSKSQKDWIDEYVKEVIKYHKIIKRVPEESKVQLIDLKSKQLVFIGKLAGEFAEQYKTIYAARKQAFAEAYLAADKYKDAKAELAVVELRKAEAQAFGNWKRWQNALDTTREEINAIKYKVRLDFADGNR